MIAILREEVKRAFSSGLFRIAVLIGSLITTIQAADIFSVYMTTMNERALHGVDYYISDSLFHMSYGLNAGFEEHTLFYMLLPILAAVPFGASYVRDRQSGYIKNILVRTEKKHYFRAKFCSVFLSGAAVAVIPLFWNLFLLSLFAPWKGLDIDAVYVPYTGGPLFELYIHHIGLLVLLYIIIDGVTSGVFAVSCLAMSYFSKRSFTVCLTPFMIAMALHTLQMVYYTRAADPFLYTQASMFTDFNPFIIIAEWLILIILSWFLFCIKECRRDVL